MKLTQTQILAIYAYFNLKEDVILTKCETVYTILGTAISFVFIDEGKRSPFIIYMNDFDFFIKDEISLDDLTNYVRSISSPGNRFWADNYDFNMKNTVKRLVKQKNLSDDLKLWIKLQ